MAKKFTVTPEILAGYRRVPGYGKVSYFDPRTGTHSSSRRYYNPTLPLNDPNREIGDSTYYRLVREAEQQVKDDVRRNNERRQRYQERNEAQVREAAGYVPRRDKRGNIVRNRRGQIVWDVPPVSQQPQSTVPGTINQRYAQMADTRQQIAMYNYAVNQGGRFLQNDRMAGGQLSNMLETLGWRPRGAPWMVGESGNDSSRIAPNVSPVTQMTLWKSQIGARTGAA